MKSPLFKSQLKNLLGVEGLGQWRATLDALVEAGQRPLAEGLERLLPAVDETYAGLATAFQTLEELSGDCVSEWNLRTGEIESGQGWKALLDYQPHELDDRIGAWQRLVHPDDLLNIKRRIAAHIQGQSPHFEADYRIRAKDGQWRWVLLRGRAVTKDERGETSRMMVLHRDLSRVKQSEAALVAAREAAEAATRARGAFLANMSHEIRTPMNSILGMTELALDTELNAEQRGYINTVKSSCEALLTIINDILDFSRIEAGRLAIEQIEYPLRAVVAETVRALSIPAHQKGLEVVLDIDAAVPERVFGDPTRLRQIINNLVSNAVKFTQDGAISVSVAVNDQTANSVFLRFCVSDTGIGIPPDKHGFIFDSFSQADSSTTRRFGGTGLGLAICARLVQLMDGRIWLDSEEGQGSSFYFTVRAGVAPDASADTAAALPGLRGKRLLIVEDHPAAAQQLVRQAQALGLRTSLATEPGAGLAALQSARAASQPFDVVLADAYMAAPEGFALAEICAGESATERLILMLSTHTQGSDLSRCRELGVRAHLVKPVLAPDLADAFALALELGQAAEAEAEARVGEGAEGMDQAPDEQAMDILLVEDNPVNQMLALRLLEKAGHRVSLANNGQEAIEQFEKQRFDAILMDVQMPIMGGIEATEAIRAREMRRSWVLGDHHPAHIIAMTAHAMAGDRERCLQAGMDDYLAKPIRAAELRAALESARSRRAGPDSEGADFTRLWGG